MRACFDAVTTVPARILGLDGYGLDVGCCADPVVLRAKDPIEAIRLRAARLHVVRRGRVIAQSEPRRTKLAIEGRPDVVDASVYAPPME